MKMLSGYEIRFSRNPYASPPGGATAEERYEEVSGALRLSSTQPREGQLTDDDERDGPLESESGERRVERLVGREEL